MSKQCTTHHFACDCREAQFMRVQQENAELRAVAADVCALARVWVTVWGDKLSAESIHQFEALEKQILKEAQP